MGSSRKRQEAEEMTVKAFAEIILELLGRNSQDFNVDERIVIRVAQAVVNATIAERLKDSAAIPGSFFQHYTFPVQYDTQRKLKYIEPSPGYVSVQDGIAFIGYPQGERDSFILLKPAQMSQTSRLEAGQLGGRIGAKPEGKRIYLYFTPDMLDEVAMIYIPQLGDLDEDAEMFSDNEYDQFVIDQTMNLLMKKRQIPEDKLTDNISN